jgi:hypothetical protein
MTSGEAVESTMLLSAPQISTVPDAIWDLRLEEQAGLYVFNAGAGEHRVLELANVDWVREGGRRGLRFSENSKERADYPSPGLLDTWLRHPQQRQNYEPHRHRSFWSGWISWWRQAIESVDAGHVDSSGWRDGSGSASGSG